MRVYLWSSIIIEKVRQIALRNGAIMKGIYIQGVGERERVWERGGEGERGGSLESELKKQLNIDTKSSFKV